MRTVWEGESTRLESGTPTSLEIDEVTRVFADYDALRLRTYRDREPFCGRIQIVSAGPATCLRFDDVRYFNRTYCTGGAIAQRLPEIEAVYADSPFGCELVLPDHAGDSALTVTLAARGWTRKARYAFVESRPEIAHRWPASDGTLVVRPPLPDERETFLLTYLGAFEADPSAFPAAVRNMRHLFEIPEIHFYGAWDGPELCAVGMWRRSGPNAFLCAGATLPNSRGRGCHTSLLAARVEAARRQGCRRVVSWAKAGGQSHANMTRLGFATIANAQAWHWKA